MDTLETLGIRHGRSFANKFDDPAFGQKNAKLTERGRIEAVHLNPILTQDYDIDIPHTPIAISEGFLRTRETAEIAGFQIIRSYDVLNEIEGLTLKEKIHIRETKKLPYLVLHEAEKTLRNPPEEKIWFSHGLRLAGICQLLGVYQEFVRPAYPTYCEIRELPI